MIRFKMRFDLSRPEVPHRKQATALPTGPLIEPTVPERTLMTVPSVKWRWWEKLTGKAKEQPDHEYPALNKNLYIFEA
jgi:hypothetical protein